MAAELCLPRPWDAEFVASHLRAADLAECRACGVDDPLQAIRDGLAVSIHKHTAVVDGVPVAVLGVRQDAGFGVPWMLGTDGVFRHAYRLSRLVQPYLEDLLDNYGRLENQVHAENTVAIRWLEHVGFEIGQPRAHPVTGATFYRFWME